MIGLGLGVFSKIRKPDDADPYHIIYELGRYAKYGGYISGSFMLIHALRVLFHLLAK